MSRPSAGSATPPPSRSATARFCWRGRETHRVAAHPDAGVLAAAADGERLVTGGDDGRVAVTGRGRLDAHLRRGEGPWIDALAAAPHGGGIACSPGKSVTARDDKGREKTFDAPSTARGLAFAPKGYRLAISHYNGATLWFPNVEAKPEASRMEGVASRRHLVARRALPRHLDAGERAARLAPRPRQGATCACPATRRRRAPCPGRMTAIGSRPPAPTQPSSGRSTRRTGRWARRRANAASAPPRVSQRRVPPAQPGPRHRLRGWLHPPRPPDRRLRAPGPPGDEGGRGDGPRLGRARHAPRLRLRGRRRPAS